MNERGLYDIYSVWHVPFWKTKIFYISIYVVIACIVLAVMFAVYRWYRSRSVALSLWDKATVEVQTLLVKQESVSDLYAQLTHILKRYISERYGCNLHADTDVEFLISIKTLPIPAEVYADIESILEGATEIKFSNISVARAKLEDAVARTRNCIQRTIPTSK